MLGWMVYAVVVTLILGAAAFVAERSAQMRKAPTRWLWAASIVASVILPLVMPLVAIPTTSVPSRSDAPQPPTIIRISRLPQGVIQPSAWLPAEAAPIAKTQNAKTLRLDTVLLSAWGATSLAMVLAIAFGGLQLRRRKRAWRLQLTAGAPTYVSEDVGPAVVGLIHPSIVVPRWIADAAPETQVLVLAHEQSHLDANDAQLLALAVLFIVAVPWNLPLWWQVRRLRFAIEVDCDARVLNVGHDVSRYGEALIMVGERQAGRIAVVAAMSESTSFLEQRIRKMLWKPTKLAWASATALAGLGVALAAAAAAVSPPPNGGPVTGHLDVSGAPNRAQANHSRLKRYTNAEWNFAVDIPESWHAFPPVPANSPFEVVRFMSYENGTHNLIVFRNPYDPATDPAQVVAVVQQNLTQGGFGNFVSGRTTIGSRSVRTLDFDKPRPDGKTWSVREYFIVDGTLMYVLGFGTTDKDGMFGLYDRMAKTFTFDEQAS